MCTPAAAAAAAIASAAAVDAAAPPLLLGWLVHPTTRPHTHAGLLYSTTSPCVLPSPPAPAAFEPRLPFSPCLMLTPHPGVDSPIKPAICALYHAHHTRIGHHHHPTTNTACPLIHSPSRRRTTCPLAARARAVPVTHTRPFILPILTDPLAFIGHTQPRSTHQLSPAHAHLLRQCTHGANKQQTRSHWVLRTARPHVHAAAGPPPSCLCAAATGRPSHSGAATGRSPHCVTHNRWVSPHAPGLAHCRVAPGQHALGAEPAGSQPGPQRHRVMGGDQGAAPCRQRLHAPQRGWGFAAHAQL